MRRSGSILMALVLFLGLAASAHAGGANARGNLVLNFRADLSGAQEVPGVDTSASGVASVGFLRDFQAAFVWVDVRDLQNVTGAHIHCARAGENGPIVVDFQTGMLEEVPVGRLVRTVIDNDDVDGSASCPVEINNIASLWQAAREGLLYINVHTTENLPGEIRGQIRAQD